MAYRTQSGSTVRSILLQAGCFLLAGCLGFQLSPDPDPEPTAVPFSACKSRANFTAPEISPYILPYQAGKSFRISQSTCFQDGSHQNQLAYDFEIPVGYDILAARAGQVVELREDTPDISEWEYLDLHNYLMIEHSDGTCAFYAHLKQHSLVVDLGDWVEQGQVIAKSGNSGFTGYRPHLHFGVYRTYPPREGFDMPVSFSNADGPLDEGGGLVQWRFYQALPISQR